MARIQQLIKVQKEWIYIDYVNLLFAFGIWVADDGNKPMINVMDRNHNEVFFKEVGVLCPVLDSLKSNLRLSLANVDFRFCDL